MFYSELSKISSFSSLQYVDNFTPAPDDWWVVVADVTNSTQAVNQGRYKEVNMVGASCITAILNAVEGADIPFVFGGDGATLLIPDHLKTTVNTAMIATRGLAKIEFDIELRFGFVVIKEIRQLGKEVMVGRFELSKGNSLAMFSGGGIELADKLIKQDEKCEQYAVTYCPALNPPDLTGLSCRWQPLRSQHGQMVCLLIQVLEQDIQNRHRLFGEILDEFTAILGQDLEPPAPVTKKTLRFKWPIKGLIIEAKLTKARQSFIARYSYLLCQSFIQLILERFNLRAGGYNAPVYREELRTNADYRRFDDTLRLVLDCNETQIKAIEKYLADKHQSGKIAYGIHCTQQAQMTCLVFSLEQSQHIHFVDGTEGGFWAAAIQYKKQLSSHSNYSGN